MALWILVYGCLLLSCLGQDLTPFIAWSNSGGLSDISATERVEDFLGEYTADQKRTQVDAVILFATKKLCFDDLAEHGNVFSSDDGSGELNNIKNIMKVSRSHYWTGLQFTSTDWVSDLATKLALELRYLNDRDIQGLLDWNGFIVISMSSYNLNDHDQIIGSVMKAINKTGITFVAIYTELSTNDLIQVAGQNKRSTAQSILISNEDSKVENDSSICSVGGIFNETNTSAACMLFCMRKTVTFIPNASNPIESCTLKTPMKVSACCEKQVNVSVNCTDQIYPSVTLHYLIENVTTSSTGNICSRKIFRSFPERPDKPKYEDATPQILVYLQFLFPNHLHNAASSTSWTIVINVTYTRMWIPKEEDKAHDNPPDDDEDDAKETISSIIERRGPSRNLYVPLQINAGLSYSCSSNEHNYYSVAYNKNGFQNGSGILLKGIQVQPYIVYSSSFSTSDDCVGYFTIVTWMGIISVSILILILYVGIVVAFSINSIVSFEDPRGETIKVEKVH